MRIFLSCLVFLFLLPVVFFPRSSFAYTPPHEGCETSVVLDFPGSSKTCDVHPLFTGEVVRLGVDVDLVGAEEFQARKHARILGARKRGDRAELIRTVQEIKKEAAVREDSVLAALPEGSCTVLFHYPLILGFSCEVTRAGLEALAAHPMVAHIHALGDCVEETSQGLKVLHSRKTKTFPYTGKGVGIAIIDSGIEYGHVCLGWEESFPNDKVVGGRYVFSEKLRGKSHTPVHDVSGHGTACAAIAAGKKLSFFRKMALRNSDDYGGGVAPDAVLYAVQLYKNKGGTYRFDEIIKGLEWCADPENSSPEYPLLVVNISLSGARQASVADARQRNFFRAVQDCTDMGITVFAATGNEGYRRAVGLPAALSNVIGVGAVYDMSSSKQSYTVVAGRCMPPGASAKMKKVPCVCMDTDVRPGMVCCFSNLHPVMTELFGPAALASTAGAKADEMVDNFGGTSAASAYVAGAAAVLQEAAHAKRGRYLTPAEVRTILFETGVPVISTRRPHEPVLQGRLVNLEQALMALEGRRRD